MAMYVNNPLFGVTISIAAFLIGVYINKKTKIAIFNPLIISYIIIISFLLHFNIDFETYNKGGSIISFFIAPAIVVLAVPLYKNIKLLKERWAPILIGITGNLIGEYIFKVFKIKDKVSKGVALGTTSHAMGIAKAMEMGETEGALGSLAITVAGIISVFMIPWFIKILSI